MSIKSSVNSKSYKAAAILFVISGLIFIIIGAVSRIFYLPIGVALISISIVFWQQSKYLIKNEHKDADDSE
jgi:hypothetical protein